MDLKRLLTRARRGSSDSDQPISEQRGSRAMSRGCMGLFFGLFFVVGAALSWFLLIGPMLQLIEARSWPEVPCTVVSSHVQSHAGDDSTTYSVEITYTYEIGGREYTGDRYNFFFGSSSGYEHKADIVEQHPPGSRTLCRVDPEDPQRSVMNVGWDLEYLWGLFPLPFLLVGLGGLVWTIRRPKPRTGKRSWLPRLQRGEGSGAPGKSVPGLSAPSPAAATATGAPFADTGPLTLTSGSRPLWRFLFALLAAGVWNSVVALLILPASQEGGCVWIGFLAIFGAVGLGLLAGVPYTFVALFNPRPTLTLDSSRLALGQSCRVSWRWSGKTQSIERLRIVLEGREEATYRRGTDTRTDTSAFARIDLVDTPSSPEIARGSAELEIPADSMHSFEAPNNKIVWSLRVMADIPRRPDVGEEHKLVIQPREEPS